MFFGKKEADEPVEKAVVTGSSKAVKQEAARKAAALAGTVGELEELAIGLNPIIGYWDPLNLGSAEFWGTSNEATVGFLRHAEIKHGRVAMAAFVGYCLQSNGVIFPWSLTDSITFQDIAEAGGPADQWDALPGLAKAQIIIFIGFLETWSETPSVLEADGNAHYMRGGIPGKFPAFISKNEAPSFSTDAFVPHPVPFNLYDPFGLNAKKTREQLDRQLLAELNNGRLAQIGIFGLISASKGLIVPGLDNLGIAPYAGNVMKPFTALGDV
jgi:hypothetical protein